MHSSTLLCRFGLAHVENIWNSLEWLGWSQVPFQRRCLNSELELLCYISLKWNYRFVWGTKVQPKMGNEICKDSRFCSQIIKRYSGWKSRVSGQFRFLLWLFRSTKHLWSSHNLLRLIIAVCSVLISLYPTHTTTAQRGQTIYAAQPTFWKCLFRVFPGECHFIAGLKGFVCL